MTENEFDPPASERYRSLSLAAMLTVALGYCLAGRVSLLLAVPPGYAAAIWPSAGIAVAAVLIFGSRIWPAVWAGSLAVNLWIASDAVAAGDPKAIVAAILIACGASVQAVWSGWLLRRLRVWPDALSNGRSITRLLVVGGPIGCVANATIGVTSLLILGLIAKGEFGFNWLNWWVGDAIGVIVVMPLLLAWSGAMGDFWRRRAVAVSVPIIVALFVVIAFFLVASNREQARIEGQFQDTALNIEAAITNQMKMLIAVLEGVQSLYDSSERVEPDEFRAFTRRALQRNPELLAISWNRYVRGHQREAYEKRGMRFAERDAHGSLVDAAVRDEYVVVEYIEPLADNREVVGFNVASNPARLEAIVRARDSGLPAATGRLRLVQTDSPEPGLLVFAPIFHSEEVPKTARERREKIAGYAVGVMLMRQFLATAIGGLQLEHVSLRLYDDSRAAGDRLLTSWAADDDSPLLMTAEHALPFAGRAWRLSIGADAGYVALHRAHGLVMVLAIGLLLCGLLGAFTLILAGHERREAIRAAHDTLTGLVNRREFERRLGNALSGCKSNGGQHALAYCDLDQFKLINDTAGHQAGDELLKQVAGLFRSQLRSRDTVARLGGDEFGLLLENCPIERAGEIVAKVCADVRGTRFHWNGQLFQIGASIGVIPLNADTGDIVDAMTQADVACYTAKDLGRNRVHVDYADSPLVQRRQTELQRVAELRSTLETDGFLIYKQPIRAIDRLTEVPAGFELLLRLRGPDGRVLPPGGSIAAAERYGVMAEIDRWVIRHAMRQGGSVCADGAVISINLSANSLDDESLGEYIGAEVEKNGFSPRQLFFEITETAAISNLDAAVSFMRRMRAQGYRFALDDFGAGISSFRYLKTLPVDWLKIDGSLVQGVATDEAAYAMVTAIQQIARTMGIATIAEWVSDEPILATLREIGVGYVQGFAVGRPGPLAEATTRPEFEPAPA